jgi:hypothetical protein
MQVLQCSLLLFVECVVCGSILFFSSKFKNMTAVQFFPKTCRVALSLQTEDKS